VEGGTECRVRPRTGHLTGELGHLSTGKQFRGRATIMTLCAVVGATSEGIQVSGWNESTKASPAAELFELLTQIPQMTPFSRITTWTRQTT
jgi:hypothetical protein